MLFLIKTKQNEYVHPNSGQFFPNSVPYFSTVTKVNKFSKLILKNVKYFYVVKQCKNQQEKRGSLSKNALSTDSFFRYLKNASSLTYFIKKEKRFSLFKLVIGKIDFQFPSLICDLCWKDKYSVIFNIAKFFFQIFSSPFF